MSIFLPLIWLLMLGSVGCAIQDDSFERTAIFPAARGPDLIREVCNDPPDGLSGFWTPDSKHLHALEETLLSYFQSKGRFGKRDWSHFRRQAVGVKRGDEELIFINYFIFDTRESDSWKTRPFVAEGGGGYFFRVLYDFKKERIVWYERNAPL